MPRYTETLHEVIMELYAVPSVHLRTELVQERIEGRTTFQNRVDVFELTGHPEARTAFAWGWNDDTGAVIYDAELQRPPIETALDALKWAARARSG